MIKNIIFDLGGVLIDWNPRYVYKTIFSSEEKMEWFLEHIATMEWNIQQDAGRDLQEATDWLVSKHPEWKKEIEAYYGRWEEMLGGPIEGSVKILSDLLESKKYRILALTNWSQNTFPIAQKNYAFLQWFEGIVVSGDEKCIKPDPEIYNIILDRYDLNAKESIFIDDNEHNINTAVDLGLKGIHFKNPEQLSVALLQML